MSSLILLVANLNGAKIAKFLLLSMVFCLGNSVLSKIVKCPNSACFKNNSSPS